jgi:hypothetical protein
MSDPLLHAHNFPPNDNRPLGEQRAWLPELVVQSADS